MRELRDEGWAAGFYEGEGTVYCMESRRVTKYEKLERICYTLRITLTQEGRWPLEKFSSLFEGGRLNGPYKNSGNPGTHYQLTYTNAAAIEVISRMWFWLSPRRKEQAWLAREKFEKGRISQKAQPKLKRGPRGPYKKAVTNVEA